MVKKLAEDVALVPRYDEELMAQIARMYYIDGFTQSMIAKQLELSKASVCMILSDAREYGIVEINIRHPRKYDEQLAAEFMQKYSCLKKCYVIPTGVSDQHADPYRCGTGSVYCQKRIVQLIPPSVSHGALRYMSSCRLFRTAAT